MKSLLTEAKMNDIIVRSIGVFNGEVQTVSHTFIHDSVSRSVINFYLMGVGFTMTIEGLYSETNELEIGIALQGQNTAGCDIDIPLPHSLMEGIDSMIRRTIFSCIEYTLTRNSIENLEFEEKEELSEDDVKTINSYLAIKFEPCIVALMTHPVFEGDADVFSKN